jgi:hypothetical protein
VKSLLVLICSLVFSSLSFAQSVDEDKFITYDPALHLGVGLELPSGVNQATYTTVVVKGYLITMGFPKEIGMQVLGLGVSQSTGGNTSLVLSPVTYFVGRINLGPEFLVQSQSRTNFGITLSYRF